MKTDLTDITFFILARLDSIERLENILCVTERLIHYFNTHIFVREADSHYNGVLKKVLKKDVNYEFIEDKDPVLYKTRHFNQMILKTKTPYIAIWDADIIPDKKAIIECAEKLRHNEADIAYPYNGVCYDIPKPIKLLYDKKRDMRLLFRHLNKMDKMYPYILLVGGAVIMDYKKYMQVGGENEVHYGWGNDDFDRYYRFIGFKYDIYRVNTPLFHLCHSRGKNSNFPTSVFQQISDRERLKNEKSIKPEIKNDIKNRKPKRE